MRPLARTEHSDDVRAKRFVDDLARTEIGATFNFYREGKGADRRRRRLVTYLERQAAATLLLVGEAAGYRGARVSGLPFTSERQLTGHGPAEASATIVRRTLEELGIEALCWNVVPTHPHRPGEPDTNRAPIRAEVESAAPFLAELARGRRATSVIRPHGGAAGFRTGLLHFGPADASGPPFL